MAEDTNIIKQATHTGILELCGNELNVAVLTDGTRIISHSAVFKALGRDPRGNSRLINTPAFIDAKNLQPFITQELRDKINKIEFKDKNGNIQSGYDALILPLVAELYLMAREAGVITKKNQLETAQKAEILARSLSKLGMIALVDEATGYQYDREKDELQKILAAYINEEIAKWQLTFKIDFYRELFRLWNIPFNPTTVKRPSFVGKLTNKYIYQALPEGVLEAIKDKTPKTKGGHYKYRFHQSLTPEIGREHLKEQITAVTTLMQISDTKEHFQQLFEKRFGKQKNLPLEEE